MPEQLRTAEGRRQALADAKRRLAERKARPPEEEPVAEMMEVDLERMVLERPVLKRGGRREWLRVARGEREAQRARQARPIPRAREERLVETLGRFAENERVDQAANGLPQHPDEPTRSPRPAAARWPHGAPCG